MSSYTNPVTPSHPASVHRLIAASADHAGDAFNSPSLRRYRTRAARLHNNAWAVL